MRLSPIHATTQSWRHYDGTVWRSDRVSRPPPLAGIQNGGVDRMSEMSSMLEIHPGRFPVERDVKYAARAAHAVHPWVLDGYPAKWSRDG